MGSVWRGEEEEEEEEDDAAEGPHLWPQGPETPQKDPCVQPTIPYQRKTGGVLYHRNGDLRLAMVEKSGTRLSFQ